MTGTRVGCGPKHKSAVTALPIILELRARRIELKLSQDKVAEQCGYDSNMLQRWENGRSSPSIHAVIDWAQALGMELVLRAKEKK